MLSPSDFGVLAMAATVTAFTSLVKDLGINQAIVQKKAITQAQINTLFWASIIVAGVIALFLAACAPLVAVFYGEPRVERLLLAFCVLVLIGGSQTVAAAILNRQSNFDRLAIVDIASSTLAVVVGIAAALSWKDYWALYAATACSTVASCLGIWIFSSYRPGAPQIDAETAQMLRFGSHLSGFNLVNYLSRNCDNILIGRFLGEDQLGLYDRAYRLLLFPIAQIHGPIGQVLIPLLSRLQADARRYRSTYIEASSLIMTAAHPGIVFAIICAPELFVSLFGPHWKSAAPIFQWLGVAALHQVMTSTTGWLFVSQGRGAEFFKLGAYGASATILSFVIGLHWGVIGVAASYTVANYLVIVPLVWISSGRHGPVSTRDLLGLAIPHGAATCGAALAIKLAQIGTSDIGWIGMAMLVGLAYLAYLCIILLFPDKRELIWRTARLLGRRVS
jgi:PST family polysaccharide transporter